MQITITNIQLSKILFILFLILFSEFKIEYTSLKLGEAERKEIYSSPSKSCVTGTQLAFEGMASSIAIITANASGKSALFFIKQSSVQIAKTAGAILSIWVITDGIVAFILGVISALLLWIFRDKSESWTLIEKWMTRCYNARKLY